MIQGLEIYNITPYWRNFYVNAIWRRVKSGISTGNSNLHIFQVMDIWYQLMMVTWDGVRLGVKTQRALMLWYITTGIILQRKWYIRGDNLSADAASSSILRSLPLHLTTPIQSPSSPGRITLARSYFSIIACHIHPLLLLENLQSS